MVLIFTDGEDTSSKTSFARSSNARVTKKSWRSRSVSSRNTSTACACSARDPHAICARLPMKGVVGHFELQKTRSSHRRLHASPRNSAVRSVGLAPATLDGKLQLDVRVKPAGITVQRVEAYPATPDRPITQ